MRTLQFLGATNNESIAKIGVTFPWLRHPVEGGNNAFSVYSDHFLGRLVYTVLPGPYVSTRHLFGIGSQTTFIGPKPNWFPATPPVQFPYNQGTDVRRYSNPVTAAFSYLEGLSLPLSSTHRFPDHQVEHAGSVGNVQPLEHSYLYNTTYENVDTWGNNAEYSISLIDSSIGVNSPRYVYDRSSGSDYQLKFEGSLPFNAFIRDVVLGFVNPISPYTNDGVTHVNEIRQHYLSGVQEVIYNVFSVFDNEGQIISLDYRCAAYVPASHLFDSAISITFDYERVPMVSWDPLYNDEEPRSIFRVRVNRNIDLHVYYHIGTPSLAGDHTYFDSTTSDTVVLLTAPAPEGKYPFGRLLDLVKAPSGAPIHRADRLGEFISSVRNDLTNLRPSSFYAVQNAVDNYISVIKANHIETISQIQSALDVVPNLVKLSDFAKALYSGNLIGAGDSLVDFLSAAHLQASFGTRPNVEAIRELQAKGDTINQRLRTLYTPQTLHGKFIYVLPEGTYGYKNVVLVTRATVRINFDRSSIMASALGSKVVGLFPGFAELWESFVPLSFVIDWFTNAGARTSVFDSSITYLCFRFIRMLYSYTIYASLDDDILEPFLLGSTGIPEEDPKLFYYRREISLMKPSAGRTQYDFLSVAGQPSLAVVGSLIYQGIRH